MISAMIAIPETGGTWLEQLVTFLFIVAFAFGAGYVTRDLHGERARRAEREWRDFVEDHREDVE